jgi:hypothetical protein
MSKIGRPLVLLSLFLSFSTMAVEFSFGALGGKAESEQDHINTLIGRANTRAGGISTGDLDNSWEAGIFVQWKFDFFAIQLRPTYFMQSEDGTAAAGSSLPGTYEYSTKATTVAAIFKLYPMETTNMRFYFLTGAMWGMQTTKIKEASFSVEASGTAMGYQAGAGLDFIFDSHLFFAEVSWRYLGIERNTVDATSGTPESTSVDQHVVGNELEYDNRDLSTNLTGTIIMVGYGYRF